MLKLLPVVKSGLGRAPATALAYMYWFHEYTLEAAFEKLRAVRPCNPRLQAIRQATCDILFDKGNLYPAIIVVSKLGTATEIKVGGVVEILCHDFQAFQQACSDHSCIIDIGVT